MRQEFLAASGYPGKCIFNCSFILNYFKNKFVDVVGAIDGCHIECTLPQSQHDSCQDRRFIHSITLQESLPRQEFL